MASKESLEKTGDNSSATDYDTQTELEEEKEEDSEIDLTSVGGDTIDQEEMEKIIDVRTLPGYVNIQPIEPSVFNELDDDGLRHELTIRCLPTDGDQKELQMRLRNALDNLVPVYQGGESDEIKSPSNTTGDTSTTKSPSNVKKKAPPPNPYKSPSNTSVETSTTKSSSNTSIDQESENRKPDHLIQFPTIISEDEGEKIESATYPKINSVYELIWYVLFDSRRYELKECERLKIMHLIRENMFSTVHKEGNSWIFSLLLSIYDLALDFIKAVKPLRERNQIAYSFRLFINDFFNKVGENYLKKIYDRYKIACKTCPSLKKLLYDYKDVITKDKNVWLIDAKKLKGEKYKETIEVRQKNEMLFLLFVLSTYYNKTILYLEATGAKWQCLIRPNDAAIVKADFTTIGAKDICFLSFLTWKNGFNEVHLIPSEKNLVFKKKTPGPIDDLILRRRNNGNRLQNLGNINSVRYDKDLNDFEIGRINGNGKVVFETNVAFLYHQLCPQHIPANIMKAAMETGTNTKISGGAPGEEVWKSMKSFVEIKYYERDRWFCVINGVCSALFFVGELHSSSNVRLLYHNIIQLKGALEHMKINDQLKMIADVYNEIKNDNPIYGLGEAKVITRKRRLKEIRETIATASNCLITIVAGNHSVTCFNLYIFDSTQTHAVNRSEANLKFLLGNPFQITAAIEYKHNAGKFRDWKEGIKTKDLNKIRTHCKKTIK